jgi:hypothetical protein
MPSLQSIEFTKFLITNFFFGNFSEELLSVGSLPFETRLASTSSGSPVSRLFPIMLEKKSNLCVAADLDSMKDILDLVEKIGDKICCLKIHFDIVSISFLLELLSDKL